MSKYYGESERLLGKVFSLANELPNGAIIFLDEVLQAIHTIYYISLPFLPSFFSWLYWLDILPPSLSLSLLVGFYNRLILLPLLVMEKYMKQLVDYYQYYCGRWTWKFTLLWIYRNKKWVGPFCTCDFCLWVYKDKNSFWSSMNSSNHILPKKRNIYVYTYIFMNFLFCYFQLVIRIVVHKPTDHGSTHFLSKVLDKNWFTTSTSSFFIFVFLS